MDNTTAIPGLTFHVDSAEYRESASFAAKGTVHLTVDIDNLETWEEVIRRLDGMRVYAIDDFHRQLMMSLQQENEQLTERIARLTEENRVVREQAEHSTAMITRTVESLQQVIGEQRRELQHHRNTAADTKALLDLLLPPDRVVG